MPTRQLKTTKLSGGGEYAKVADRMLEFRKDFPRSKSMTDHEEVRNEAGQVVEVKFYCWLWKDKKDFDEMVKSGVTDINVLRSTADSDGAAKADAKVLTQPKAFEKHQSVATGRALAYLGYAASGEIASFEEMELYEEEKARQAEEYVTEQLDLIENAKSIDDLREIWKDLSMKAEPRLMQAKDKRKVELESKTQPKKVAPKEESADESN